MSASVTPRLRAALLACALLAGCASPQPVAFTGLASAPDLQPNPQDDSGHVPFRYAREVAWQRYTKVIVEPVALYAGPDHQFGDMTPEDRDLLARYMQARLAQKLATRFTLATTPGADTLRVRVTLTGAVATTPVLSTLTRFNLAGGLYNGVQAVRGREGMLTGSVTYAVEIHDAASNELLYAAVTRQYPGAYNIAAGFGTLAAARTGIDKGTDALLDQLK